MEKSIVPMQIRLPANLHEYAKEEAAKMGIPLNSFLVVLMTQGKKLWEAKIETTVQVWFLLFLFRIVQPLFL